MAIGPSGKILIEVSPSLKQQIYNALHKNGYQHMREWFLDKAKDLLESNAAQSKAPDSGPTGSEPHKGNTFAQGRATK